VEKVRDDDADELGGDGEEECMGTGWPIARLGGDFPNEINEPTQR
jgi:hypothetical protein